MRRSFFALLIVALAVSSAFGAATRQEMVASAAFTASSNSASFSISTAVNLFVGVDITAASGTPVLDLWLQGSDDGGTTWYDYPCDVQLKTSLTASEGTTSANVRSIVDNKTSTTAEQFMCEYKAVATDKIRLKWIISGTTPSFTFSASYVAK
jgi:hypothetical protein